MMRLPLATASLVVLLASCTFPSASGKKHLSEEDVKFPQEWHLWKGEHGKTYQDLKEELGKHLVWLGNQEYINQHNRFSHIFGYTLKMNRFGDMVKDELLFHKEEYLQ